LLYVNRLTYDRLHEVSSVYTSALYVNVCDYINSHLEEDLSLDALADFFFVSKYHISHVFKNNMGISLHQYVLKKRLHACKNGILAGSPVGSLFQQYGFSDYSSFYRAFKKEYGLSPTEFRLQHVILAP
jgi:YesN/AraC family two-component response regulator